MSFLQELAAPEQEVSLAERWLLLESDNFHSNEESDDFLL